MPTHDAEVRLRVTADLCPQMMLRILGVVSRQSAIPRSVAADRSAQQLQVDIALDDLAGDALDRMRAQMAAIVGVRSVREI